MIASRKALLSSHGSKYGFKLNFKSLYPIMIQSFKMIFFRLRKPILGFRILISHRNSFALIVVNINQSELIFLTNVWLLMRHLLSEIHNTDFVFYWFICFERVVYIISRQSLGLKSILNMPGLEPGTSRLSMLSECAYHLRYIPVDPNVHTHSVSEPGLLASAASQNHFKKIFLLALMHKFFTSRKLKSIFEV